MAEEDSKKHLQNSELSMTKLTEYLYRKQLNWSPPHL